MSKLKTNVFKIEKFKIKGIHGDWDQRYIDHNKLLLQCLFDKSYLDFGINFFRSDYNIKQILTKKYYQLIR